MPESVLALHYIIDGQDFSIAGEASSSVKNTLKKLNVPPQIIRNVTIAMYEAEINAVIHAGGGEAFVQISADKIKISIVDNGPGIADIELAMTEGYSTAGDSIREMGFGAGMGLPNIKKYTDGLNISSTVGKGTTVELIVSLK